MTMAATSLQAYDKVRTELNKKEGEVYDALCELGIATNDELAAHLKWPVHCVTGRTNNLWKKSFVVVVDQNGVTPMGNRAKRWGIADANYRQLSFIKQEG